MVVKLSASEAIALIAKTQFSPFTESDWHAFMGCEADEPFIGYNGDYCLVLDGETVNIFHAEDEFGGQLFSLSEM
jgi:hypothetical protein